MNTLLLDTVKWDLLVDANGNIAVATGAYAQAQDAASAARTFRGEVYYDTSIGVPYAKEVLGKAPPLSFVKAVVVEQALRVPGITAAQCFINSFVNRKIGGQLQIVGDGGATVPSVF